ncbi:hypothetical protein K474DRAFT_1659317 [Panus rudis PR-1116 ss-1]|nr:hypothetical protein K474DRAFT_1659317 [Panus rudis PR-1116 ss-1]
MATFPLYHNSLYVALFTHPHGRQYDWSIYIHADNGRGMLYHIRRVSGTWVKQAEECGDIRDSDQLVVCVRIATISAGQIDDVHRKVQSSNFDANNSGLTSKDWVRQVLTSLSQDGFVRGNLRALEKEVQELAFEHHDTVARGKEPAPVLDSNVCQV